MYISISDIGDKAFGVNSNGSLSSYDNVAFKDQVPMVLSKASNFMNL